MTEGFWQQIRSALDWLADVLGLTDEEDPPLTAKERAAERWGYPPRVISSRSAMLDRRSVRNRVRSST